MQFPQIRLQSQHAQIQLSIKDATLEMQQPKADLSIQQPPAELSIRTTPGKLNIDQSQAWAEMNLKTIPQLVQDFAAEGRSKSLEGIGRRASEGAELMQIENGGDPLVSQAVNHAFEPMKRLGITFIPSPFSVKMNYQPAEVQVDVKVNKPIIESSINKPVIHYEKGSVETSLKLKEDLQIDFVNITV
ncbi:DUF6470 family protein [Oceanobacillus sp. Castelsardo]|uniref:DUF6470 family protein n=1 Tax=Oceanobacillus sp. Castelsardo TaxID=1851204 RepID=UPI0008396D34|nr:DUF6470 family protein [Oceanobacillus sp. Castelsardo]